MNDDLLGQVERHVVMLQPEGAPDELRMTVLSDVRRELRAARWDRRLARAAALLLVVGVCLNAAIGLRSAATAGPRHDQLASERSPHSLAETARLVADATDAETGRRFARQLAAMSGRELTIDEAAAIDAAVRRTDSRGQSNGNKG